VTVRASVLIPTHDHGPLLHYALRSALSQTVREIEVLVVGDGAPDVTRHLMREAASADPRVRYFDHPKGPRHGEVYRHEALAEARGEVVCYLADDDLYLPHHVESMLRLLRQADFASALPIQILADGALSGWTVDLSRPSYRRMLLSGTNRVPLSCGAHTLAFYRGLPAGWRTTPPERHTDLYMWQQILSRPGCRAASAMRPTVLHFPSSCRRQMGVAQRLAELQAWEERLLEPGGLDRLMLEVAEYLGRDRVRIDEKLNAILGSASYRLARRLRRPFSRPPEH
jgi:hypothetical protein